MAASGDVTLAEDGGHSNVKLHPYLVALVRWCVSCLWSTATVLLHRLMTAQLPQIAASRSSKSRPAGKDHLDPEPKVECVVLHQPSVHTLDVVFVHGLYGSLGNTWRQGEWRSKYVIDPEKVHLRRPTSIPTPNCLRCDNEQTYNISVNENLFNNSDNRNLFNNYDNKETFTNIDEKFYKEIKRMLPNNDEFTTEKFYNNTLLDQVAIVSNYDTQAKFVSDLFRKDNDSNLNNNEENMINNNRNTFNNDSGKENNEVNCKCNDKKCEIGCGCICDECYSPCWPKDWIKVDYPGARVISINYTSDPHLWRPLWIKENKRLRLHERAEQMTQQLLDLEVGKRPVIWVGHSKGGLFIKQIYCEAYEAHLKTQVRSNRQTEEQNLLNNNHERIIVTTENLNNNLLNIINNNSNGNQDNNNGNLNNTVVDEKKDIVNNNSNGNQDNNKGNLNNITVVDEKLLKSSNKEEDRYGLRDRASLWSSSAGFMFYSVPHRGSPLADIKTPVTARSVELLEITKDCSLVLTLQQRWLAAAAACRPLVRSLVETRRTLMSVLWLRIVSADSADPGIGALCGVSVDHREICKPSSRQCLLYTELATLIGAALNKCRCQ